VDPPQGRGRGPVRAQLALRRPALAGGRTTFEAEFGLDPARYAAHGGAFPVLVRDVGPVGVVVVSGLPQVEDHRLVVAVLRELVGRQRT